MDVAWKRRIVRDRPFMSQRMIILFYVLDFFMIIRSITFLLLCFLSGVNVYYIAFFDRQQTTLIWGFWVGYCMFWVGLVIFNWLLTSWYETSRKKFK